MADIEAVEILTQAKERLFECGWVAGPRTTRRDAVPLCLEESLFPLDVEHRFVTCLSPHNAADAARLRAALFVRDAIGDWDVPDHIAKINDEDGGHPWRLFQWNDEQKSAGAVFDAIDRAIEIAKEVSNPA